MWLMTRSMQAVSLFDTEHDNFLVVDVSSNWKKYMNCWAKLLMLGAHYLAQV